MVVVLLLLLLLLLLAVARPPPAAVRLCALLVSSRGRGHRLLFASCQKLRRQQHCCVLVSVPLIRFVRLATTRRGAPHWNDGGRPPAPAAHN